MYADASLNISSACSKGRYLVFLADKKSTSCPISWNSNKVRQVATISYINYWDQFNSWKNFWKFWNGPICRNKSGPYPYSMLLYIGRVATSKLVPRNCLTYFQTTLIMRGGGWGRGIGLRIYVRYCRSTLATEMLAFTDRTESAYLVYQLAAESCLIYPSSETITYTDNKPLMIVPTPPTGLFQAICNTTVFVFQIEFKKVEGLFSRQRHKEIGMGSVERCEPPSRLRAEPWWITKTQSTRKLNVFEL